MGIGKCHRNSGFHEVKGYGLPGRTSFSIFSFDNRDKIGISAILLLVLVILTGAFKGETQLDFSHLLNLVK